MNKRGQNLIGQAVIFLGLWLITSLIWAIWLDDILVPLAGCLTSLAALGMVNMAIHFHR